MKNTLLIILTALTIFGCKTQQIQKNISVNFNGLKTDTIYIGAWPPLNNDDSKEKLDTIYIKNGKLNYLLPIEELHKVVILPKSSITTNGKLIASDANRINFYINKQDKIIVNAKMDGNFIDYNVKGNAISEQHSEARKKILPILKERHQLVIKKRFIPENEMNDSLKDYLFDIGKKLYLKQIKAELDFTESHPDYEYSAWILFNEINTNNKEKVIESYERLSENVKQTYWGKKLKEMVYGFKVTLSEVEFPQITDKEINGNTVKLSDYKGKYLLIDFWGSWCGPCIKELPKLKQYQETYKQNFDILGIACNDNLDKLKSLVKKQDIKWNNILSSNESSEKNYVEKFQIHQFPTKILLDKKGNVIQTYIGSDSKLYEKLNELLLN